MNTIIKISEWIVYLGLVAAVYYNEGLIMAGVVFIILIKFEVQYWINKLIEEKLK